MAHEEPQHAKRDPALVRAAKAARRAALAALEPVAGRSTRFGRAVNALADMADVGLMAGPPIARMRFRPPRFRVPERALRALSSDGSAAVRVPSATVRLPDGAAAAAPVARSAFAHPPGDYAVVDGSGKVTIPGATRELASFYGAERVALPGGRKVALSELPAVASEIDASRASAAEKAWRVRGFNDAVNPTWMYRMYERDLALANDALARENAASAFDERLVPDYHAVSRAAAATALSNPLGTRFAVGGDVLSPVHVSGMYRSRFDAQPSLYDAYNAGHLPFQSVAFGTPGGRVAARLADHAEAVDAPASAGITASGHARADGRVRTVHVRGEVPAYGFEPKDPGGVRASYVLDDGTTVESGFGNFFLGVGARQDAKGGDNDERRHESFRNFLATDEVPDTIFGYPVVQDESQYTDADLEFFRENPKAAGFYDRGDDEIEEDVPQQAAKAEGTKKVSYDDLRRLADTKYAKDADPIKAAVYSLPPEVVSATVDSFGGNIDRAARPVYLHKDAEGWVTGYSTTNSGDALDPGTDVSSGKFKAVLVPFVRFGKGGKPEYTEDRAVAQKWYDESGQHYGKFDMDFTSEAAKKRSVDRFNAASWLVHREQQLRYQPVFDKMKAEANAARLGKLWASAVKATGGNTNGMAKVFYAMTGESAPNQRGASDAEISNGYRVRLAVHGNETRRKKENPHNKGLADTYTNLGTLEKDSDVIQNYKWGTGPGTNWFDVATMQPRYEAIVRDPTALATTRSLIVDAARFLNGELSVPGLPSDAYHYGDGRKGLVSDAKGLSTAEMKAIGPLPKNFRVGRKKGR